MYTVYKLTCPTGKSYIGRTKNYNARLKQHQSAHSKCTGIHDAIVCYGWDSINIEVLKSDLSVSEAAYWEGYYVGLYNTMYPNGYNKLKITSPDNVSTTSTQLMIDKMSAAAMIRPQRHMSEETRKKISVANKGRKHSTEFKLRISVIKTGVVVSEETRKKLSNAGKGRVFSAESKQKISNALKGNKGISKVTAEQVIEIRRLYTEGVKQVDIAKMYNISNITVHDIVHRKNWRHI